MSPKCFVSAFTARRGRAPMCCISPPRARRRSISWRTGVRPELIVTLSDINMPRMDGLSLLREIKTRRPDLPVMMVTAYSDDERRRQAEEAGAFQFLSKPVDFDLLKEELARLPGASE